MTRLSRTALVATLLVLGSTTSSIAQGVGARSEVAPPNHAAELVRLRLLVESLERRVEELEEQEITDLEDKAAEATEAAAQEAKTAKIEQRLATLEQVRQNETGPAREQDTNSERALTVVAPFTVVDESGRTMFRVDVSGETNQPRALVGNPTGARVELGVTRTAIGGGVVLYDNKNTPRGILVTGPTASNLYLRNAGGGTVAALNGEAEGGGVMLSNASGHPIAELRPNDGRGLFLLNDPSGSHMVEAGSLVSGKGYVLTTPYQNRTGLAGDPSVLMGGRTSNK